MKFRTLQRFRYLVEIFLSRGAFAQLALVAALIIVISVLFGALEFHFASDDTRTLYESIWWAFLRLTDPGYLGDDAELVSRTLSTALTILGYVLFMGSLVAILTQWLNRTMQDLEAGLTPIIRDHHILVAGSNEQAELVVQSLFESYGRARRFLARRGKGRRLHVVLLSERAGAELRLRLQHALGSSWHSQHFTMRKGVPWDNDHLMRVDFSRASVVILPAKAADLARSTDADNETIKTLLSASHFFSANREHELPGIVVEIYDARKLSSVLSAYHGPVYSVPSSRLLAQLIAQSLTDPGIIQVYAELMEHNDGNELYLREGAVFAGLTLNILTRLYEKAIPIGIVATDNSNQDCNARFLLDPTRPIESTDMVVFIAPSFDDTELYARRELLELQSTDSTGSSTEQQKTTAQVPETLLILGWNRKGAALVNELLKNSVMPASCIHVSSRLKVEELSNPPWKSSQHSLNAEPVIHRLDNTIPEELSSINPGEFSHIVILSSDWLNDEGRADSRAIASLLSLENALEDPSCDRPHVVVELLDPSNASIAQTHADDILVSTDLIGHILAQIALRPEIRKVYDALLATQGPCINMRQPTEYGYMPDQEFQFIDFQEQARRRGEIAIGAFDLSKQPNPVILNPARDTCLRATKNLQLLIVSESRPTPSR